MLENTCTTHIKRCMKKGQKNTNRCEPGLMAMAILTWQLQAVAEEGEYLPPLWEVGLFFAVLQS